MSQQVSNITQSSNLANRLSVKGNDELSFLKNSINLLLEKIETMNNQLFEFASFDIMTGAYNRRGGLEKFSHILMNFKENFANIGICYIDLNDLKKVNDTLGHINGDQMIVDTIRLIKKNTRNSDILVRMGGDEFLIIFPYTTKSQIELVLERMNADVAHFNSQKIRPYSVSFSKGVVIFDGLMTCEEMIEEADKAMYLDKKIYKQSNKSLV